MEEKNYNENAPESLIGAEIDGYRLESVLGHGSFGVVYLARHLIMERLFAFKILQSEFSSNEESVTEFFREGRTAAKLDHPNVVQAIKAGRTDDDLCYFVMEYVEGSTIEELRINSPELLTIEFLLDVSIQLADALDYAWKTRQIIHRDIKPENLLIRAADRKLKLADLGLAGVGSSSNSGEIVATPMYMAPEVAAGLGSQDVTGDIYSFGIMFYELLAGAPPFNGTVEELQRAHIEELPPPLLEENPDLDPNLANYIDSLLAKSPADRPQSWAEVREKLILFREEVRSAGKHSSCPIDAQTHSTKINTERRRKTAAVLIAAVLALVGVIAIIVFIILL